MILNRLSDFSPAPEREPNNIGYTDVRLRLDSPAVSEADIESLQRVISEILRVVPDDFLSPMAEFYEELVEEENILSAEDAAGVTVVSLVPKKCYVDDNRNDPGKYRLYASVAGRLSMPDGVMSALTTATAQGAVRFINPVDIEAGVSSGLLTRSMAVIAA